LKYLLTLTAVAVAGAAAAQGTLIYAPVKIIGEQGISVRGWGSGTISETDETAFEGTHSIRISSRNYFQVGILTFATPVNLSTQYADNANLLRVTYKLADGGSASGGGVPGGRPGGGPGAGPGGGLTGGPPGGRTGGGPPGGLAGGGLAGGGKGGAAGGGGVRGQGPGAPGGFPGAPPGAGGQGLGGNPGASGQALGLETMRVIITTTDGKKSEAYIPTESAMAGERGWMSIAIPLKAISGFDATNKTVKSIAFAPDQTNTFYIGELRVVEDTTPIRGQVTPTMLNLGANQEVRLNAFGLGGASILKYEWDFDDSDGIQVDATGRSVTRKFRKPGEFTITLTISDYFGLKQPYTTTLKAKVNP
jgi:hypothetical protein